MARSYKYDEVKLPQPLGLDGLALVYKQYDYNRTILILNNSPQVILNEIRN